MTPDPLDSQEEAVRRLLAAAGGHPDPLPADVADRLDRTLAGLVTERAGQDVAAADSETAAPGTPAEMPAEVPAEVSAGVPAGVSAGVSDGGTSVPADELAARRTRRWPRLLVAAAAVGVVGIGIGTVLGQQADQESSRPADSAGRAVAPESAPGGPETDAEGGADEGDARTLEEGGSPGATGETPGASAPALRTVSLTADVERLLRLGLPVDARANAPEQLVVGSRTCRVPATSPGDELLGVRLDGRPAVLVVRAPDQGERRAEVSACADPTSLLGSTTVPAR